MEWYEGLFLYLSILIFFLIISVPVAFAFLATNILGWLAVSDFDYNSMLQIVDNASSMISRFTLGPVPLFILMGSLFYYTGLATRVFDTIDILLGKLPGRLSILTLFGGSAFSTLIGSSMANVAMLGTLILPQMRERGYNKNMSLGPILGTGGLAIIIPPSSIAILLASIADIDIGKFLIACILPGFILALMYLGVIILQIYINPKGVPNYEIQTISFSRKIKLVIINILPMFLVIFSIMGVIIFGIATPTESAAIGVLSITILALCYRSFSFKVLINSLHDSVKIAGAIFFILMNSAVFSQLLAFSGTSTGLMEFTLGYSLDPKYLLICMICVLLLMGTFMDSSSIMLISVPILFPIAISLNIDPLLFALIVLITIEMAGTTPPFGVVLYVMMGLVPKDISMGDLIRAALPYLLCDLILIIIVITFPSLVLWLPYALS